jgi:hypothetical protein
MGHRVFLTEIIEERRQAGKVKFHGAGAWLQHRGWAEACPFDLLFASQKLKDICSGKSSAFSLFRKIRSIYDAKTRLDLETSGPTHHQKPLHTTSFHGRDRCPYALHVFLSGVRIGFAGAEGTDNGVTACDQPSHLLCVVDVSFLGGCISPA